MTELTIRNKRGTLTNFNPEKSAATIKVAQKAIELARDIQDWSALENAVATMIGEQSEFVAWWDGAVRDRGRPVIAADRGQLTRDEAESATGIKNQQVSRWRKRLEDAKSYAAALYGAAYIKAMAGTSAEGLRGTLGTGENEWYTPPIYLAMAREVLGEIDLDPASSETANKEVKATRIFTQKDDGLKQEWAGRIWLNPPYAQPLIVHFTEKMVGEWKSGRVSAAIVLTHNYTDTAWFQNLASEAAAICFTRGRVRFVSPEGELAAPTQGQAFSYFGDNVQHFADVFGPVGFIAIIT